jgi:hypothetical protein
VATRLVQLLLPLTDNDGRAFAPDVYADLHETLTARFGGLTAYMRSPAEGLWAPRTGELNRDRVVLVEVMDTDFDAHWWRSCRTTLERVLRQESVVIRALPMEQL